MSEQHPEIVAAPFTIWIAPVGTAFPALLAEPGEAWTLLGTNGARNQGEGGIVFVHDRQWVTSTPAAETGESVSAIERESLLVQLQLLDMTLEQYAIVLGSNLVTQTAATPTEPGVASVGLSQRIGAAREFAVLVRGQSAYGESLVSQYELPRCCETGSPRITYRRGVPSGLDLQIRVLIDPAAISEETRFGRLVTQTAPSQAAADGTYVLGGVLYGPKIGPKGPMQLIYAVWNQGDVGYCYETNNVAEPLPAKWAARGLNTWKPGGHPDQPLEGRQAQTLAAVEAANLMMICAPRWEPEYSPRADLAPLDLRNTFLNDDYWRVNLVGYQILDEIDLAALPLSTYEGHITNMSLDGTRKPVFANFTRRVAVPASSVGSASIHFYEAFNVPEIVDLGIDSYEWHLDSTDDPSATATRTQPAIWVSPWNNENQPGWPRFTASVTGLAVHMQRSGPVTPGRSDTGEMPVQYPPIAFNDPPFSVKGLVIPPQPHTYDPGDKSNSHYIATGRVDISGGGSYARGGQWQPGRYLRNEGWSGFVHGSSALCVFPQTVGSFTATGYVDAATETLHVTGTPQRYIDGAMRVSGPSGLVGWIRRDSPQLTGTAGGIGSYALDATKITPVNAGSVGTPVTLTFSTEARPWGDDTNAENLSELVNLIANLNRMQAHPTGGNLMIDTTQGGRRAFTVMRCPEVDGDASLYKDDMTRAPLRAGYTAGGAPINDAGGKPPLWDFGWPMGFEGFRVTGDDGAVYSYVRSMSNGDAPTWFPGFAPLGLPARAFGPFEMVGFRRVGTDAATEMTGTSGIIKAGVDDGAATWFFIETLAITQNEGNSGTTAYTITVRRGGSTAGTRTVDVAVSGTGVAPANAADFSGGSFPGGTLTFLDGEATKTFTANVVGDTSAEFDETFKFTLSNPSGGAVLVASGKSELTCTITNDDAAVASYFVWLGNSLSAAPAISGAPSGATWLNSSETSFVTRGGVTMRAVGAGFASNENPGVFGVPYWGLNNFTHGVEFELPAGNWEVAFLTVTDPSSGGTIAFVDDPAGTATTRYSYVVPSASLRLLDTDGTVYTDNATGATDALNNLTFAGGVTVTDLGGGVGRLRVTGTSPYTLVAAVALREA